MRIVYFLNVIPWRAQLNLIQIKWKLKKNKKLIKRLQKKFQFGLIASPTKNITSAPMQLVLQKVNKCYSLLSVGEFN